MREVGPGDDTEYRGIEAKPEEGQGKAWAKVWDGPQHIIFGHDHKKGLQVGDYFLLEAQFIVSAAWKSSLASENRQKARFPQYMQFQQTFHKHVAL